MEFTYQMFSEQYNYSSLVNQAGNYSGPETVTVMVDEDGKIVSNGTEVVLSQTNPNHIILMDILEGSTWFTSVTNNIKTESVGPYINLKSELVYAPSTVWNINKTTISGGVVTYGQFDAVSAADVKAGAATALVEFESKFDRTSSQSMKSIYSKLITICEWITIEWNETTIPAYKIVIPTIDTIDEFNDVVV